MYFSPFSLSEDGLLLLAGSDFVVAMEDRFAAPITFAPIAVDDVSESLPEKFPSDGAAEKIKREKITFSIHLVLGMCGKYSKKSFHCKREFLKDKCFRFLKKV